MEIILITILIFIVQTICPILANIDTNKLKDKNGIISIKSRLTYLTET